MSQLSVVSLPPPPPPPVMNGTTIVSGIAKNIEIKVKYDQFPFDLDDIRLGTFVGTIHQRDTYFSGSVGRLKMREEQIKSCGNEGFPYRVGKLIHYARSDSTEPKESDITAVTLEDESEVKALKVVLERSYGVSVVVDKKRRLYNLGGRTRIHLDYVVGLGKFLEIEVVVQPNESPEHANKEIASIMASLGIESKFLVAKSYSDLVLASLHTTGDEKQQ